MSRARLPPPPGSRGRPLPPEPPSGSDDTPPPLPSRPGHPKPPTMRLPPTPQPPESPESSEDEGITYEEPNEPQPPPVTRHPPPPQPQHQIEQETYDEFEGMGIQGQNMQDDPGETYDACDIQTESQPAYPPPSPQEDSIYEEGDIDEDNFDEQPDGDLYEFMPEESVPSSAQKSTPPPPMQNHLNAAPSLPSRPPPSRHEAPPPLPPEPTVEPVSERPGRVNPKPAMVKQVSSEGQIAMGISLHELGARKANLKKVESREIKEEKNGIPTTARNDVQSVKDKINIFKQVEQDSDDDSDDEPPAQSKLLSELTRAMGSLKSTRSKPVQPPPPTQTPTVTKTPEPPSPVTVTNTAKLSIQERIALMKGKSVGGLDVQAVNKPPPTVKPSVTAQPRTTVSPVKALKPVPSPSDNKPATALRSRPPQPNPNTHSTYNSTNNHTTSAPSDSSSNAKPVPPPKPTKPSKPSKHATVLSTSPKVSWIKQNVIQQSSPQSVTQKPAPETKPSPTVPLVPSVPSVPRAKTPPLPPPPTESYEESDDIYDEGFSYVPDPLSREEWYHGEIERAESTKKLHAIGQDGTFLVRKSKQGGDNQPYTLVVLYQGHVYNLKIRVRSDGQVALGESKSDELAFKDVPALIQHHRAHDVILVNVKENKQHKTLLKKHPIAMRG